MIRDFLPDDVDAVVEVWRAASEIGHPFLDVDLLEREAAMLRDAYLVRAATRVVDVDGRVVGFISMIGHDIGGLFVDPGLRRRGPGRAPVEDVRGLGSLEVEVCARNEVGRLFYEGYGFTGFESLIHEETGEVALRMALG